MDEYHFKRMADWFQYAALGGLFKVFCEDTPKVWSASRLHAPNSDLTRCKKFWDIHDQVHGPMFQIRTNAIITHTAKLCSANVEKLRMRAKADAFETHVITCGYNIIYSVGRFEQVALVTDKCETCGHEVQRSEVIPDSGSGFVERAGRTPNWEFDEWKLLHRPGRLLRYITKGDEAYWSSEFRLQIDNVDGDPKYWRLDRRPWFLK